MNLDAALRLAHELPRYDRHVLKVVLSPNPRGVFTKNILIPKATRKQTRRALYEANSEYTREEHRRWVSVDDLVTEQATLVTKRLVYQLRRFDSMQAKKNLPLVIKVGRVYVIWDGNHRCTSAILLGKKRILCRVLQRTRKKHVKRG